MPTESFEAPWSQSLKILTGISLLILVGLPVSWMSTSDIDKPPFMIALTALFLTIAVVALFFVIRGYDIVNGKLHIQRLSWSNAIDLSELQSAEVDPQALRGAIRTFGNGGLFSFSGWFWSRKFGAFRVFVNDPKRSVVLRFPSRVVVVSPDNPGKFVSSLQSRIPSSL